MREVVVLQKPMGIRREAGELSLYCHPEPLVDEVVLGQDIPLGNALKLTFADHVMAS
jgi:hypothetical protein